MTSGIRTKDEVIQALTVENQQLETWIDDLQSGMWINCVYCGHRYGPGTEAPMRKALEQHIAECPKHPLSAAKQEIAKLKQQMAIMPMSFWEKEEESDHNA